LKRKKLGSEEVKKTGNRKNLNEPRLGTSRKMRIGMPTNFKNEN